MANYESAVKKLQDLLAEKDLEQIPHTIDNKIVIGSVVIKPTKGGNYIVIDRKSNSTVLFYSKISALAFAKNIKHSAVANKIEHIDSLLSKHEIDCRFYRNTIKKSKSSISVVVAEQRYDVSKLYVSECKQKLYDLIFNW